MNELQQIAREIRKRDDFLLVGHAIPDGDCIGSIIGLYLGMISIGKNTRILLQDPVPAIYNYLLGSQAVLSPEQMKAGVNNVIFLDCSDEDRSGEKVMAMLDDRGFTINIDHHQSNTLFGNLNYVDYHSSSTAELVLELLKEMDVDISADIANALYAGIIQDTGGFQHSNTTSATFLHVAELMDRGVNLEQTKLNLFESKSRTEVMLLCRALKNINFNNNGKIAWMTLEYEELKDMGALQICPEGIINYIMMIKGVEVGLMFRELSPGLIKIGFRSKGEFDVSQLAARFGGGGHRRAAGAQQVGTMEEIVKQVICTLEGVMG